MSIEVTFIDELWYSSSQPLGPFILEYNRGILSVTKEYNRGILSVTKEYNRGILSVTMEYNRGIL